MSTTDERILSLLRQLAEEPVEDITLDAVTDAAATVRDLERRIDEARTNRLIEMRQQWADTADTLRRATASIRRALGTPGVLR